MHNAGSDYEIIRDAHIYTLEVPDGNIIVQHFFNSSYVDP